MGHCRKSLVAPVSVHAAHMASHGAVATQIGCSRSSQGGKNREAQRLPPVTISASPKVVKMVRRL
jgi:hypothetical protein